MPHKSVSKRVGALLALAALAAAGCSETPFSGLGEVTESWIAAAPTSTTLPAAPEAVPAALGDTAPIIEVEWVNDDLGDPPTGDPDDAIATVWARSNKTDRFVQASRFEIAVALPGIEFPAVVPEGVRFVTSQLIFDPATGRLDDQVAAFGFWSVEPYSRNRSVGQRAVLFVAEDAEPEGPPEGFSGDTDEIPLSGAPEVEDRCEELLGGAVNSCTPVTIGDGCPAWSLDEQGGWRLVWSEQGYEYDLFVRDVDSAEVPFEIAGSCSALGTAAAGTVTPLPNAGS